MPFQSLPMPGDGDRWLDAALAEPLYSAWNGYGSSPMGLTGINDDVYAAATLRNRGLGPAFLAQDTDGMTDLMTIDDIGTSLTNLFGSGTADIDGATDLGDTLHGVGAVTFDDTLLVAGDGTFEANVEIQGDLHVVGAVTFDDTLHGVGAVTFDDTLLVAGAVTFDDTLDVAGDGTFEANVEIQGDLLVSGNVALAGDVDVTGPVTVGDTLEVAGETILGAAVTLGGDPDDPITVTGHLEAGVGIGTTAASPPLAALHVVVTGAAPGGVSGAVSAADGVVVEGADQAYVNVVAPTVSGVVFSTPSTWSAGSIYYLSATDEVVISTTDGDQLRVGSGTLGFFNGGGAPLQTVEPEATDLPTVIDLANSLRDIVLAYTLAEE